MNEDLEGNLNKKRKISIHVEEEVTGRDDRADPPEREVDNVVVLVDDVADPPPKEEVGFKAPEEGIVTMGDPPITGRQDPAWRKENQEDWLPTGWRDCWMCVETQATEEAWRSKVSKSKRKQEGYRERISPNLLLTGWRVCWSRMDAEANREKSIKVQNRTRSVKAFFQPKPTSNQTQNMSIKDDHTIPEGLKHIGMRGTFSSKNNGTQSPKRKTTNLLLGESPLKQRRVSPNFSKSLSFWK